MSFERFGAGIDAHAGNAVFAARTAASISSSPPDATSAIGSLVDGFSVWNVSRDSTYLPSIGAAGGGIPA